MTRDVIEAVLLARFGSAVADEIVTVFVIEFFFAITVTTIWIGWLAWLASEPRLQLTTPDAPFTGVTQEPWLIVADTNVLCDDRASLIKIDVAVEGPALKIVIV